MTTNIYGFAKKVIKFYIVWWIATLWNMLITFLVTDILHYSYNFSLLLVFLFNITAVFYLQKYFTFKNTKKHQTKKQVLLFVFLVVTIMIALKILVPLLNPYINNYALSTLIVAFIITIINFLIQNFLIFNHTYDK